MSNQFTPLLDRFNASYTPEPNSGCWLWASGVRGNPARPVIRNKGKSITAYRVSYELFKGPIPFGLLICHSCDTPLCVNPDHLFPGTIQDNFDDCWKKGRTAVQKKPSYMKRLAELSTAAPKKQYQSRKRSIIPHEDVPRLLKEIEAGVTFQNIADRYGVSKVAVGTFVAREHLRYLRAENSMLSRDLQALSQALREYVNAVEREVIPEGDMAGTTAWHRVTDTLREIEESRSSLGEARVSDAEGER